MSKFEVTIKEFHDDGYVTDMLTPLPVSAVVSHTKKMKIIEFGDDGQPEQEKESPVEVPSSIIDGKSVHIDEFDKETGRTGKAAGSDSSRRSSEIKVRFFD